MKDEATTSDGLDRLSDTFGFAAAQDLPAPPLADDGGNPQEPTASVAANINALCSNLAERLARLDGQSLSLSAVKMLVDVSDKLMHTATHTANVMTEVAKAQWSRELARRLDVEIEVANTLDRLMDSLCAVNSLDDVGDVSVSLAEFVANHCPLRETPRTERPGVS